MEEKWLTKDRTKRGKGKKRGKRKKVNWKKRESERKGKKCFPLTLRSEEKS